MKQTEIGQSVGGVDLSSPTAGGFSLLRCLPPRGKECLGRDNECQRRKVRDTQGIRTLSHVSLERVG